MTNLTDKEINALIEYYGADGAVEMPNSVDKNTLIRTFVRRVIQLEAELAKLRAEQEWRPIESAPKDVVIVGWRETWECGREVYWVKDHWECAFAGTMHVYPTYWRHLPTPPQDKEGKEC